MRKIQTTCSFATLAALAMGQLLSPSTAQACGGFFCNGGPAGPTQTPVVQAAERVIFEQRDGGEVRAYVQIQYDQQGGAPIGFSWVVPVMNVPELGVADEALFDQLDSATSPQFRFINNAAPSFSGGGSAACTGDSASPARGSGGSPDFSSEDPISGVTVWDASRIGDYETAVISGETAEGILGWLAANDFDIPESAMDVIGHYVFTGHVFAAFRFNPIDPGSGTLPPVVITYRGAKPCVPVKITAIASLPVLDVMVLAFGDERSAPTDEYTEAVPDYDSIRVDGSTATQTTYTDEVDLAIDRAGGHAFVIEHAGQTATLEGLTDPEALALVARNSYVTRLYTRLTPEQMDIDPEFEFVGGEDVNRLHVVDITPSTASLAPTSDMRFAHGPAWLVAATALLGFRRRRRHGA